MGREKSKRHQRVVASRTLGGPYQTQKLVLSDAAVTGALAAIKRVLKA